MSHTTHLDHCRQNSMKWCTWLQVTWWSLPPHQEQWGHSSGPTGQSRTQSPSIVVAAADMSTFIWSITPDSHWPPLPRGAHASAWVSPLHDSIWPWKTVWPCYRWLDVQLARLVRSWRSHPHGRKHAMPPGKGAPRESNIVTEVVHLRSLVWNQISELRILAYKGQFPQFKVSPSLRLCHACVHVVHSKQWSE